LHLAIGSVYDYDSVKWQYGLERIPMTENTNRRWVFAVALSCIIGLAPTYALAQQVEATDETAPAEPTLVEDLAPSGEGEGIPGTEPLYDKGITVTRIDITGNKTIPAEDILKAMATQPGRLYSKNRLQNDLKKVYELGYFTDNMKVVPIATREGVHLQIEVEENPTVNAVIIDGETVMKEAELQKLFADQIGKPQNVNLVNKGIQSIEQQYQDKGYILARVDDISEDPPGTVHLRLNEGKLHHITYTGNKKTKDFVIRRAMAQKEGEVYNDKTVSEDLKRIYSTQVFSDVRRVIKASGEAPGEYDLTVEVDEKKTGAISLGGGMDTANGLFGSVGYNEPNFLGRGQNFSSTLSVGTGAGRIYSYNQILNRRMIQFQTSWFNPSMYETDNSLGASVYARDLASFNVPLAIERRYGGDVTWGKPLESLKGASMSVGLGFEKVDMQEGVSDARLADYGITPAMRINQLEDGSFVSVTPTFTWDTRNNRFNPNQGWLATVSGRGALGLGIDSYGTLSTNVRRYLKVTDNVTFAINGQAGGTAFGNIPAFNMFRLGGSYSVRGFQEGGIGVGENYVLGSAELRTKLPFLKMIKKYPVYDMLQGALFADAGYLFNEADTNELFDRPGHGFSVGAGLRMNLPAVGPLRIDWATPIGDAGGSKRNLNFGVGNKF